MTQLIHNFFIHVLKTYGGKIHMLLGASLLIFIAWMSLHSAVPETANVLAKYFIVGSLVITATIYLVSYLFFGLVTLIVAFLHWLEKKI